MSDAAAPCRECVLPVLDEDSDEPRGWVCPCCGMLWKEGWYRDIVNDPTTRAKRVRALRRAR